MNVSDDGCWCWPGTFQSVDNVCPWASILLICCRAMSGPSDTGGIDYLQAPSPPWHKVCTAAGGWQSQHIFIQLTIDSKICQLSTSHLGQQSYNRPLPMLENNFMIHVSSHFTVPLSTVLYHIFLVITTNLGFCTRVGVTNHPMTEDLGSWGKYLR